jgi:hypothetical protein
VVIVVVVVDITEVVAEMREDITQVVALLV